MKEWTISFISKEDLKKHIAATISQYDKKLVPIDIEKFNSNIVDPIKMMFDKNVYRYSWEEIIRNEVFRQRDKSNSNDIGYFHQRIFQYMKDCRVPDNGKEGGWDVILSRNDGILLPDGDKVKTVYVEMKNKHNTMNSSAAGKTYIKMQNQLLNDDDCACFLVEAIAKRTQNVKWTTSVDGRNVSHKRIRRVSLDEFYSIVTGVKDAFYQLCLVLPETIAEVVSDNSEVVIPNDTVYDELINIANHLKGDNNDMSIALAILLLGFSSYNGFTEIIPRDENVKLNEDSIKRIYKYAKMYNDYV